jgi:hypothetical protein
VQRDTADQRRQRHADRAAAAGEVYHGRARCGECRGLAYQQLGAATRDEDPRVYGDAQPAKVDPADDMFQRLPGDPPLDHGRQRGRRRRGVDQQLRLVFSEHAPGGAEPADDGGPAGRRGGARGHAAAPLRRLHVAPP